MPKVTPQQAREKHARNLKASTQFIAEQVNKVTVAPGVEAAKKQDKMLTNITQAINSGRWARRVASVPLATWQQSMITKGIPRISQGVDAAAGKIEGFFSEFFPHLEKMQSEIKAMPDLTLEDNIQRAVFAMRRASEFKRGQNR